MSGRFRLIGRVMDGTKVNGYWLQDGVTGKSGYMQKEAVDKMALAKMISNCTAQSYKDVVTLKGKGFFVSKLPKYDKYGHLVDASQEKAKQVQSKIEPEYALMYKVMNSKLNTGFYALHLKTGNKVFLTREEVIQLATAGKIQDVRTNRSKDKFILRGTKTQIEDLPAIQPSLMSNYMYGR